MKVLIACEESQEVCKAFRALGHEAFSCDILPCSGGHPEWHIRDDVLKHLNDGWDLMIAHPPCTYLSTAGASWLKRRPERKNKMKEAALFFKKLLEAPIDKICVENPTIFWDARFIIGSSHNQVIEPYMFGDPYKKKTCLWLKNLPKLQASNEVKPENYWVNSSSNYKGKLKLGTKGQRDPKMRSKTFPGIAKAMAEQWGISHQKRQNSLYAKQENA